MDAARALADRFLGGPGGVPLSFTLDGRPIRGIPASWNPVTTRRRIDANLVEVVFEAADPASGLRLRVEGQIYQDFPVVEWTAWLTNVGAQPSPLVEDLLGLDAVLEGEAPVLVRNTGDFNNADGYRPEEIPLGDARVAPSGGRPCDSALPYFRLRFGGGGGLTLSVGWPAQWAADFAATPAGTRVRAGQEKTRFRLMPGESARTPRMTLLAWAGGEARAINLWRRWVFAHVLPRPNGQPLGPKVAWSGPGEGIEFTAATEENQGAFIPLARERDLPFDVWWIDAGWYPCRDAAGERKWPVTGSWEPDPERFPRGLMPVSECATRHGADLLLWFEPERVRPGTRLDLEHPEWLLRLPDAENRLLNLGLPACREWLTDHVCALIRDNGIRIYRQDFNFRPLDYWRSNEPEDRQGMNENLHVQGYLQYWDDLLARNPGLWLDSCASGGRRNDLESLRRSVPLHYTDHGYGDHAVKLAFQRTMHEWMPYFKESELSWDLDGKGRYAQRVDSFSYHCGLGALFGTGLDVRRDDLDYALARRMIGMVQRAAQWVARQFDCPEDGAGFIQAIRLQQAPEGRRAFRLHGLVASASYRLQNAETGETREAAGAALMAEGLTFEIDPRSGALWFYQRQ